MKDLKIISKSIFLLALIILMSCDNTTKEATEHQQSQPQQQSTELKTNQLKVIGNNINLLNKPSSGEGRPIGQAQDGEIYDLIGSSANFETIGRETDYWYAIEKMGEKVWIFGAYTSKNLNDNPQVFRGKYDGIENGDYFHLSFSEEVAKDEYFTLDFGNAGDENNYGDYELETEEDKYKGRTFDVTWNVKPLNVYKGEGSMETEIREVPVIVDLKLIE